MIAEMTRYLKKMGMLVLLYPLRIFPIKSNRLLFDDNLSHKFCDNIKPIINCLLENYEDDFEIYLSISDMSDCEALNGKKIIPVQYHSIKYFFIAMTSKFFISNSGGYSFLPLRKTQYVINTWHGGGAYKRFGVDAYNVSKFYRYDIMLSAKKTSYFLSTCKRTTDIFSKALLIPRDRFWEIGMPRNDILFHADNEFGVRIKRKLGLDGKKFVLYAPTYRRVSDDTFGESVSVDYGIDTKKVCEVLNNRFGGEWIFAVRLHPAIKKRANNFGEDVLNLSEYDDMQEVILASDAMINDFSSSMWDYMLTGKPGFMFATDIEHYVSTTALYTPIDKWPFKACNTNDELIETIKNFDYEDYRRKCREHYQYMGGCESGEASRKVCELIYGKSKV